MTTDYDCNCIHEKMPGLCCEVPESYAHFTACELICERKSKLLKKKRVFRQQNVYLREQRLCQMISLFLLHVHVFESNLCSSENVTSHQGFL